MSDALVEAVAAARPGMSRYTITLVVQALEAAGCVVIPASCEVKPPPEGDEPTRWEWPAGTKKVYVVDSSEEGTA